MTHELIDRDAMARLLGVARAAVDSGLGSTPAPTAPLSAYPESLRRTRGSFVTLKRHGELRGCIGSLSAVRPLVEDVAKNAAAAAFRDPRFEPVTQVEAAQLHYHISVLSPQLVLDFDSFEDLEEKLQPGVHGLVLAHGDCRATYLPSVWELIPDTREFVRQLRAKAGIAAATPVEQLDAWVYTVQDIGEA